MPRALGLNQQLPSPSTAHNKREYTADDEQEAAAEALIGLLQHASARSRWCLSALAELHERHYCLAANLPPPGSPPGSAPSSTLAEIMVAAALPATPQLPPATTSASLLISTADANERPSRMRWQQLLALRLLVAFVEVATKLGAAATLQRSALFPPLIGVSVTHVILPRLISRCCTYVYNLLVINTHHV